MTPRLRTLARYAAAVVVAVAFAGVAELFSQLTGSGRLTAIFLSSVMVSAFLLGPGPGLLTAIVAFVAHLYLVDPPYALSFGSVEEVNGLMLFLASSILTCLLARGARRQADAESRAKTEDLRNALLASISHDLRTPLSAIMASAGSLRRYGAKFDAATRDDLAATIEEEARRLDAFVGNLLQMTRLQSGAIVLEPTPFRVEESIVTALRRRSQAEQARVSMALSDALPEALGDPILYEQAIGNVLENALRHSEPGTPVAVKAEVRGREVVVLISDHGPGVPDSELEKIFEKFFRSAGAARRPGTGLGLAIVRGLIEAMGGRVSARNGAPDVGGLVVALTLPAAGR